MLRKSLLADLRLSREKPSIRAERDLTVEAQGRRDAAANSAKCSGASGCLHRIAGLDGGGLGQHGRCRWLPVEKLEQVHRLVIDD